MRKSYTHKDHIDDCSQVSSPSQSSSSGCKCAACPRNVKTGQEWGELEKYPSRWRKKSVFNAQTLFSNNNNSKYRAGLAYREGRQLKIVQVAMKERMVVGHPSPKKTQQHTSIHFEMVSATTRRSSCKKTKVNGIRKNISQLYTTIVETRCPSVSPRFHLT